MGSSSKYLVIYHAVSAGQNGSSLGCDEEDIVMIVFLVLDREENKVSRIAGIDETNMCKTTEIMSGPLISLLFLSTRMTCILHTSRCPVNSTSG